MAQGADVIAHNCDAAAAGLFEAADKPGVYTFGVNSNQNDLAPNVLSSARILDIPKAFVDVAQERAGRHIQGPAALLRDEGGRRSGDR